MRLYLTSFVASLLVLLLKDLQLYAIETAVINRVIKWSKVMSREAETKRATDVSLF